jgi:hypothetical protein
MQRFRTVYFGLFLALAQTCAWADKLDDNLQTMWESLWDQRGTPYQVIRWDKPVTYRIHGVDAERHTALIKSSLHTAADIAGLQMNDLTARPDAQTSAMLDIEVVHDTDLQDNEPCVTHFAKWVNWAFVKVQVKMRSKDVGRCALHETMHVMGIAGHPSGKTVLSYFAPRSDVLMDLDRILLKAWYSPEVSRGATPLEIMAVLSKAVARQTDLGLSAEEASRRARLFNHNKLLELQALASGKGAVPGIVIRSGKSDPEFIAKARPAAAYFVGVAYMRGMGTSRNDAESTAWFGRAARQGHSGAQVMYARALIKGIGVEPDQLGAHSWLSVATRGGNSVAGSELVLLEQGLKPEDLDRARSHAASEKTPS